MNTSQSNFMNTTITGGLAAQKRNGYNRNNRKYLTVNKFA